MYKQHTLTVKTIQYTISKLDIENCIYFTIIHICVLKSLLTNDPNKVNFIIS